MKNAKKPDVVVVATPGWEERFTTSIMELCRELADQANVLFVENPHTLRSLIARSSGTHSRALLRVLGFKSRIRVEPGHRGGRVNVLTPPPILPANVLPPGRLYRAVMRINAAVVRRSVLRAMRRLQINRPIVVNAFCPTLGLPLAGRLGESLLVYYCYDEIRARAWNGKHGAAAEYSFIQKCDLVLTTSTGLFESRKEWHADTQLLKNGVNFELFNRVDKTRTRKRRRPCAGYIGSLDDRVDFALLEQLCSQTPEIEYLFVGRVVSESDVHHLARLENVRIVGPRPPGELPQYLGQMDVGLIPFVCDEFTRNIYPLKINEYLAAGRPVVRTPFSELPEFDELVANAGTAEEFVHAVRSACLSDDGKAADRVALARTNSWRQRADDLMHILQGKTTRKEAL